MARKSARPERPEFGLDDRSESLPILAAVAIGAAMALIGGPELAARAAAELRPSFAGSWQLDSHESETARGKVEESRKARRPAGVGAPRPGDGRGSGSRPGNGSDRAAGMRAAREQLANLIASLDTGVDRLEIEHEEAQLVLRYANGVERVASIGGETVLNNGARRAGATIPAEWRRGGRLRIEREAAGGVRIRETLELVSGERLQITVEVPARERLPALEFRRIYDRVPGQSAAEGAADGS